MTPDRWFTLIVSGGTFLLGWLVSHCYQRRANKRRIPTFIVQSQNLVAAGNLAAVGLAIMHETSTVGLNGITDVSITFWNSGTLPILRDEVLEPYTICLPGPVLYSSIAKSNRAVAGLQLSPTSAGSPNELPIEFSVLESGDGGTIRIVYDGPNAKITFKGTSIGASRPKVLEPDPIYTTTHSKRAPYMLKGLLQTFAPLFALIVVAKGLGWVLNRFFGPHVVEIATNVFIGLFLLFLLTGVGAIVWFQYKRMAAPYLPPDVKS